MDKVQKKDANEMLRNISNCLQSIHSEINNENPNMEHVHQYLEFSETFMLSLQEDAGFESKLAERKAKNNQEVKNLRKMVDTLNEKMSQDSIEKAQAIMESYSSKIKDDFNKLGIVCVSMSSIGILSVSISVSIDEKGLFLSGKTEEEQKAEKEQKEKDIKFINENFDVKRRKGLASRLTLLYNDKNKTSFEKIIKENFDNVRDISYEAKSFQNELEIDKIKFSIFAHNPYTAMVR